VKHTFAVNWYLTSANGEALPAAYTPGANRGLQCPLTAGAKQLQGRLRCVIFAAWKIHFNASLKSARDTEKLGREQANGKALAYKYQNN
jgi:hypothetical protein